MHLIVNGQIYDSPRSLDKKGGEGELYTLAPPKVAKVYKEQFRSRERSKKVHDLLQITKLYTVFDVHDDETKAISSFSG